LLFLLFTASECEVQITIKDLKSILCYYQTSLDMFTKVRKPKKIMQGSKKKKLNKIFFSMYTGCCFSCLILQNVKFRLSRPLKLQNETDHTIVSIFYTSLNRDFQSLHREYWETSNNKYNTRLLSVVPRTYLCEDFWTGTNSGIGEETYLRSKLSYILSW
jgi:hypothetical protein